MAVAFHGDSFEHVHGGKIKTEHHASLFKSRLGDRHDDILRMTQDVALAKNDVGDMSVGRVNKKFIGVTYARTVARIHLVASAKRHFTFGNALVIGHGPAVSG